MKYFIYCRKSTESEDRQVLSLESQRNHMQRIAAEIPDAFIIGVFEESRSAKTPGRPVFNDLLARIEKGEAEGIIAWHPDRLARNALDGGQIIHLLDSGKLKDLRFGTATFENTSQGKLNLSFLFSFSKYYVDSLSENVRRGQRTKAERGWSPGRARLGYMTDPATKDIVRDPDRFPLVKRVWELMLTGTYTPRQVLHLASNEWGLTTRKGKRVGGGPLSLSGLYAILASPFYAGQFTHQGRLYSGKHEPMITIDQFDQVQKILHRPSRERPIKKYFPYTGLMRCGSCGLRITAEDKINRYGSRYAYYHCTRRKGQSLCRQPYVSPKDLEESMAEALEGIALAPRCYSWVLSRLERFKSEQEAGREAGVRSAEATLKAVRNEVDALTKLRMRDMITDDEFLQQRRDVVKRRLALEQRLKETQLVGSWIEPCRELVEFSSRAAEYFRVAPPRIKRMIVETVCSNPLLTDKIFSGEARKPFRRWSDQATVSEMCGFLKDVRTFSCENDESFSGILRNITLIKQSVAWPETTTENAA